MLSPSIIFFFKLTFTLKIQVYKWWDRMINKRFHTFDMNHEMKWYRRLKDLTFVEVMSCRSTNPDVVALCYWLKQKKLFGIQNIFVNVTRWTSDKLIKPIPAQVSSCASLMIKFKSNDCMYSLHIVKITSQF